jgi:hypothetical protein
MSVSRGNEDPAPRLYSIIQRGAIKGIMKKGAATMTIEIQKPELEALIRQRMQNGTFQSVEDILIDALKSAPAQPITPSKAPRNLADILGEPPFAGSNLDLERRKDYPRSRDL